MLNQHSIEDIAEINCLLENIKKRIWKSYKTCSIAK